MQPAVITMEFEKRQCYSVKCREGRDVVEGREDLSASENLYCATSHMYLEDLDLNQKRE